MQENEKRPSLRALVFIFGFFLTSRTAFQPHRIGHIMDDITKFVHGDVLHPLSFLVQSLIDFDRRFLHDGVRLLAATPKDKILSPRHTRVTIVAIQADSHKPCDLSLLGLIFRRIRIAHDPPPRRIMSF